MNRLFQNIIRARNHVTLYFRVCWREFLILVFFLAVCLAAAITNGCSILPGYEEHKAWCAENERACAADTKRRIEAASAVNEYPRMKGQVDEL